MAVGHRAVRPPGNVRYLMISRRASRICGSSVVFETGCDSPTRMEGSPGWMLVTMVMPRHAAKMVVEK